MTKAKPGHPTDYQEAYVQQAIKLCELAATDADLAEFFDVSVRTIYRWAAKYPEFCHALKIGKDSADERVVRSLYHRAVGYTFDSEKIFQHNGRAVSVPFQEHVPPDTTAAIFWLKNRRRGDWRDRHEHTGANDGPIQVEDVTDEIRVKALMALLAKTKGNEP